MWNVQTETVLNNEKPDKCENLTKLGYILPPKIWHPFNDSIQKKTICPIKIMCVPKLKLAKFFRQFENKIGQNNWKYSIQLYPVMITLIGAPPQWKSKISKSKILGIFSRGNFSPHKKPWNWPLLSSKRFEVYLKIQV